MQFQNFEAASRKPNLKPFALMMGQQDLTWIATNYSDFQMQDMSGTIDGTNATFTLPSQAANGVMIFRNGLAQYEGVAFTRSGQTITFIYPYLPQPNDLMRALTW